MNPQIRPEADAGVPAPRGAWEFNAAVADSFDEHVRKSIPDYETIQRTAASLCEWFAPAGGYVQDWGCATGQTLGIIAGAASQIGKPLTLIGWDCSEAMVAKARAVRRCDIRFEVGSIPGVLENAETKIAFNFGVALYTLQFLTRPERRRFLKAAEAMMIAGGGMFIVEKVHSSTAAAEDIAVQLYHEWKLEQGFTLEQVKAKERSLRGVMHPMTVAENEADFAAAGFRSELIYRRHQFAGWIVTR